jgi:hypothetical protein
MKVHSLTILHYGKDYLSYALRSVYHSVDQCHIFYTPTPSHGHSTNIPPIETKEELMQAAYAYDPDDKIKWYDMIGVTHEGPQRDMALQTVEAAGAEIVLVVDYDEVWPQDAKRILDLNFSSARNHLINMVHFWRSFNWACKDDGWPVRIIDLRYQNGTNYISPDLVQVFHFGYAVTNRVMRYKWKIHGHKNELRVGWLDNIWSYWPPVYPDADGTVQYPGDYPFCCHPTNEDLFWEPEPFDKNKLPEFMQSHPFWGMDKIE